MNVAQRKVGVIISYASQFVQILTGLIYTPIMLRILGQSQYGLYQLVYSVVSYLSLLSLGFGASYMRFYAREKAHNDKIGVAKLNGMFMIIFIIISIICLLCGFAMVSNIRVIFGKGLSSSEYQIAEVLMILMIINLALTFPNSVFNCIVTSQERFLFQKGLILIQNLLSPFLTLPLLLLGFGSVGMVSITTILTLAVLITNMYYCLKILKAKFIFKNLEFSKLKEMWIFTFFIFINQIVDQINWSVDKFLLGRLAGTTAVAIYGVGGQINTMYLQFSSSVSNVFVPKVNEIVAENQSDNELTRIFVKVGRIQFIVMTLIMTGFIFFGQAFIQFWAGNGYSDSYVITLLLIVPVTVPLIQNIGIEIQRAKNKHKARSYVYLFIAILNIFISIPLIKLFGPIGAALGTNISLFLGNILFMNWYYNNKLGINIPLFWRNIASFIPALLLPIIFGIIVLKFIVFDSLAKLLLYIVIYTVIYIISICLFGMNSKEKEEIVYPLIRRLRWVK